MKLIATNKTLEKELFRLISTYQKVSFAVAWATANTSIFKELIAQSSRIEKAIIGTHFYQTHPDVLDIFTQNKAEVRFMLQPKGIFHPKMYIFCDEKHWEALIGSANLTSAALTNNSEVMVLISDSDDTVSQMKKRLLEVIDEYWINATAITEADAHSYRALWERYQPTLKRLAGQYGKSNAQKPPTASSVMSMTWSEFFTAVKKDPHHNTDERCQLLEFVRTGFKKHPDFSSMELGLRKTIAGLPNDFNSHWGWFGSMKGAGYYHQAVNENNPHISAALDKVPLDGPVSGIQYNEYLAEFVKAFPNGRHGVSTASRLLALKRPDQFVCFDARNREKLCEDFGIKQTDMTYERYWDEVIERIMDSPWWNSPRPIDETEGAVWDGRAALLDVIFYKPEK